MDGWIKGWMNEGGEANEAEHKVLLKAAFPLYACSLYVGAILTQPLTLLYLKGGPFKGISESKTKIPLLFRHWEIDAKISS